MKGTSSITVAGVTYQLDCLPPDYEVISSAEAERGRQALLLLSDLDRCQHGRHHRDGCWGCQALGVQLNAGNWCLETGQQVGQDISGRPITVPEPSRRHDPAAWRESS